MFPHRDSLYLQKTRHQDTEVRIVRNMRIPKRELERLCRLYAVELERGSLTYVIWKENEGLT